MDFKFVFGLTMLWFLIMARIGSARRYTCDLFSADGGLLLTFARASRLECASRCQASTSCYKFRVCPDGMPENRCSSYDVVAETKSSCAGGSRKSMTCRLFKQIESTAKPSSVAISATDTISARTTATAETTTEESSN
ncbi:uncharacterized protein LOC144621395 [Crassostrea virginica]